MLLVGVLLLVQPGSALDLGPNRQPAGSPQQSNNSNMQHLKWCKKQAAGVALEPSPVLLAAGLTCAATSASKLKQPPASSSCCCCWAAGRALLLRGLE
jgi:hypothetical protein